MTLLNLCDPTVNEFFFGGRTIIVEGDTEYTAFKHVVAVSETRNLQGEARETRDRYRDVHIVRARGKVQVALLARILNKFNASFAILHDSDHPAFTDPDTEKTHSNSAWMLNRAILAEIVNAKSEGRVRHLALVPDFETALFGREATTHKPYNCLRKIREDEAAFARVEQLLQSLLDSAVPVPSGCVQFDDISTLHKFWDSWHLNSSPQNAGIPQPSADNVSTQKSSVAPVDSSAQANMFGVLFSGTSNQKQS